MLKRPRAVLFDLDGALIDSRDDIAAACNHALVAAGRPALPEATIAGFVGDGARALLARAFAIPRDAPEMERHLAEWAAYYAAHPIDRTAWMPGAREAIEALRARGARIGLATNKLRAVTLSIVRALGVEPLFDAVWAGGDGALKPAPDSVRALMTALGARPDETWLVGDGAQDVGAANAAGCAAIAVLGGFHAEDKLRAANPTAVLASMRELIPLYDAATG